MVVSRIACFLIHSQHDREMLSQTESWPSGQSCDIHRKPVCCPPTHMSSVFSRAGSHLESRSHWLSLSPGVAVRRVLQWRAHGASWVVSEIELYTEGGHGFPGPPSSRLLGCEGASWVPAGSQGFWPRAPAPPSTCSSSLGSNEEETLLFCSNHKLGVSSAIRPLSVSGCPDRGLPCAD